MQLSGKIWLSISHLSETKMQHFSKCCIIVFKTMRARYSLKRYFMVLHIYITHIQKRQK